MALAQCPGQDKRFWSTKDIYEIKCPECGAPVELWKDDIRRLCPSCKKEVFNPKLDLSCAQWCQYADKCLDGVTLEEKLISEMYGVFGRDQKRIQHSLRTLDYARKILKAEGGSAPVVTAAAILHDIGIQEAERKHGSPAPQFQEMEGPPIAREILLKHAMKLDLVGEVCECIAHHHERDKMRSPEEKIVYDADCLVNLEEDLAKGRGLPADAADNLFSEEAKRLLKEIAG
jgi:HD superfamily phosphohydrolase YqeK